MTSSLDDLAAALNTAARLVPKRVGQEIHKTGYSIADKTEERIPALKNSISVTLPDYLTAKVKLPAENEKATAATSNASGPQPDLQPAIDAVLPGLIKTVGDLASQVL